MLFDFARLPVGDRYKLLTATVVPRPIAWVVSQDVQGRHNAAPFSFFNVFSPDPAVICLGIAAAGPGQEKDTLANIRATEGFVVNLVPYELMQEMHVTAIDFPAGVDELAEAGLATLPSAFVGPPRIAASPVALECRPMQVIDLNQDRALVLAQVVAMHVRDDSVLDVQRCHIDTLKLDLVGRMHGGGGYVRTTGPGFFERARLRLADWVRPS
jgi:flavin reductase (DIM6/NTAB) family NADH-FMN oxidoreductase RutF